MSFDPTDVPVVRLNDGAAIPQFGFGVFQITRRARPSRPCAPRSTRATGTSTPRRCTATSRGGRGHRRVRRGARGDLRDDEAGQRRPRLRRRPRRSRREPAQARLRPRRPLPHPLAAAAGGPLRRDVDGAGEAQGGRQGPVHRRLQLHGRAPGAARRADGHRARGEPDRAAPVLPQAALRAYHAEHGIATEAWSPIGQGGACWRTRRSRASPTRHGRTPAQVVLRWHIQLGNIVFPKSVTPERIRENIASSTSSCRPTTWPSSTASTPAPARAPTPTGSAERSRTGRPHRRCAAQQAWSTSSASART